MTSRNYYSEQHQKHVQALQRKMWLRSNLWPLVAMIVVSATFLVAGHLELNNLQAHCERLGASSSLVCDK